jgi:uncharacterized protein YunC (DUF1805 family)
MDWTGLERHRIDLAKPLLLIRGSRGILGCGYLNVDTFDKTGEAAAIVTGVGDFDAMLEARTIAVSHRGRELGAEVGMPGETVLSLFR